MNHLYHTLSPFVLLAAFLVSLLAFLAPTPILSDRVSLLSVSTNVSSASASSTKTKRWLAESQLEASYPNLQRMVKRTKKTDLSASSAASTASKMPVTFDFGPLGACYTSGPRSSASPTCASPSFTPTFIELFDNLTLPTTTSNALPAQFPLAPTALLISLLLLAVQLVAVVFSSISMHATKKAAFLLKRQATMRKTATGAGMLSLALMLAATIALHVQLSDVVDKLKVSGAATASFGSGFAQLFAGAGLQAIASLLLVSEAFTNR
ncbi:hypothetical protein JCM21900_003893 [Sporobolomyces salmonicolor]